jgi:hypothetical protein
VRAQHFVPNPQVDALDDYVHALPGRVLEDMSGDVHASLAQLLPSYPVSLSASPTAHFDPRHQAHRAMSALLSRMREREVLCEIAIGKASPRGGRAVQPDRLQMAEIGSAQMRSANR